MVESRRVKLVPHTLAEVHAMVEAMTPSEKAQLSADWLVRLHASTASDPWTHGFSIVNTDGRVVGDASFKGPPSVDGIVEIAYRVNPEDQGKGYATLAAQALFEYAARDGKVRIVQAHTLPESNASTKVLTKCGFRHLGEVMDLEDGLVWRWEKKIPAPGA